MTISRAQEILKENDLEVSEKEAERILEFMFNTAEMLINTLRK